MPTHTASMPSGNTLGPTTISAGTTKKNSPTGLNPNMVCPRRLPVQAACVMVGTGEAFGKEDVCWQTRHVCASPPNASPLHPTPRVPTSNPRLLFHVLLDVIYRFL